MNERILDGRLAKNKNRNNYSEFVCTETESNVTKANTSAANVDFMAGFGNLSKGVTFVCVCTEKLLCKLLANCVLLS